MNSLIVDAARYLLFFNVAVVVVYWISCNRTTKFALGLELLFGGVLAFAIAALASRVHYDTRPFVSRHIVPLIAHAADNGFPSDHALLASFLGFTILYRSRRLGVLLLVMALFVGAARVAAHIHNPQDVVASFAIAALSAAVVRGFGLRRRVSQRSVQWPTDI